MFAARPTSFLPSELLPISNWNSIQTTLIIACLESYRGTCKSNMIHGTVLPVWLILYSTSYQFFTWNFHNEKWNQWPFKYFDTYKVSLHFTLNKDYYIYIPCKTLARRMTLTDHINTCPQVNIINNKSMFLSFINQHDI